MRLMCLVFFVGFASPRAAIAQLATDEAQPPPARPAPYAPATPYAPITNVERIEWIVKGTIGPKSLGVGLLSATWSTAWNSPEEWGRSTKGFVKRYFERELDVTLSNSLEAGLGAIWGEDPRYIRAPEGPARSRLAYAMKTVVLAHRRDGRLAPAWARYAGNTLDNVIENAWLPSSVTTGRQTALRTVNAFVGRLLGNVWEEFWPDIRRRFGR